MTYGRARRPAPDAMQEKELDTNAKMLSAMDASRKERMEEVLGRRDH